jgi:formylglycine-generating enzyme required for sulfatase activity
VEQAFEPPKEFDDYLIVQELGRGQMGQVYLAEDAVLARPVAIKFIAGVDPDLEARQRFLMEARAAARIQHPNVVSVYRVGELGDRPYIVSELIRGKSLREHPRPMPWAEALVLAIELARGLAAAHRRGVVHCDLKPENAMVTEDGVPKLVDFGLARVVHEGGDDSEENPMVGTPDYMAPEVWGGRAPSRRSDVYSFGAVLYELVAGTPPFASVDTRELGKAVREQPAPSLQDAIPDLDPRFARLVARCLERDPELRYPSGEELREALEQIHPSRSTAIRTDENPYRGLRTFEATHRGLFFGRGLEISAVTERLRTDAVVIVTGDSGVGKSSLLRAGVIPAIIDGALGAGRSWETLTMIPGRRPLAALAAALGDPTLAARILDDPENMPRELQKRAGDKSLLLFVDQMEELVTVADAEEVAAFDAGLARISEGVPGVRLITTVRADFLSRIAALPRLGRELSRLLYFLSPLPPERIRDVITGPANATSVTFESEDMIGTLVEATAHAGSGGLPLLSFALAELWEARDREKSVITQVALDTMGGVAGALARHGDSVLAGMPAADRIHARRVLLRLVTSVGTRVRRTEAELSVGEGTRIALDALVKGRLLVVHDGEEGATFELAHEVLVRGWGTLREWLEADAEDRARRERVAAAAADWSRAGRRGDMTFRGPRLIEARSLDVATLTVLERDFIVASLRATQRRLWVRRALIAAVVVLLVLVFVIQRYVAQNRLDDDVAAEVTAAREFLDRARTADRKQQELATAAFAKFDASETDAGEEIWRKVLGKRAEAEQHYRTAGGRVETALAKDPTRDDVRAVLGDILFERALLADNLRAFDRREELLARLDAYDPGGARRARWSRPGQLIVRAPGATIGLERDGKRLGPGGGSVVDTSLAPGTYTLVVEAAGRETVRTPVLVERDGKLELEVVLPREGSIPAGFVYIPPGSFLYGSATDEDIRFNFFGAVPMHRRSAAGFLIGKTEVTISEWLAFVEEQPPADHAALLPPVASVSGGMKIEKDGTTWRLAMQALDGEYRVRWGEPIAYKGRTKRVRQDWRKFPMTGITPAELARYFAWLDRTGKAHGARLCTEPEWEYAGRGVDGRDYPHGKPLAPDDANFELTYGRPAMSLDEVGAYPATTSPFGLLDMSGNAFEWVRPERVEGFVVRGGSFFSDRKTANLANRSPMPSTIRDAMLGARVCASLKPDALR